jgi:hypothetical protein
MRKNVKFGKNIKVGSMVVLAPSNGLGRAPFEVVKMYGIDFILVKGSNGELWPSFAEDAKVVG